jgi:hypothetical protein
LWAWIAFWALQPWMTALSDLVSTHLAGWPTSAQTDTAAAARAKGSGAAS